MGSFLELGALFFSPNGRIARATFWWAVAAVVGVLVLGVPIAERVSPRLGVPLLDAGLLLALAMVASKRLKDRGRSPWRLLFGLIPVLGPLWLLVELGFRRGTEGDNHYGEDPLEKHVADYATVEASDENVVEEVTRLYPTRVFAVARPTSVEEVQEAVQRTNGALSVGGGRFSMGGQVASEGSLHIDMRGMNRVLALDLEHRTIRVQAGIRWCDIQRVIDPHDLSIKIMQTYANFTVGGSLSVNCHGRYVGAGPLVLSVRSIVLVLASGDRVEAGPDQRPALFYGAIGGYGSLGVICEAVLELAENTRVEQRVEKVPAKDYADWFARSIRNDAEAVFHNGDLYTPELEEVNAVSWVKTKRPVTTRDRLMQPKAAYPLFAYLFWAVSETPLGKWRRRYLIEPLFYLSRRVHWRNYEAGYDVGELEPRSRAERTYVLQEYFVPVARFDDFVTSMREILERHRVNMLNVSIRHALPDPGTLLAWAPEECFAFVCYYKQRTRDNAKARVAVWTRELIDAVLDCGGSYYLPYQAHATREQFHRAYPRARELFALKREVDPEFRLRGVLMDQYHEPGGPPRSLPPPERLPDAPLDDEESRARRARDFHSVFFDPALSDAFYAFLQNVFHLFPEDRFHHLLSRATAEHEDEDAIYRVVQEQLPTIKPFLSELTYALPALRVQKAEMTRQTLALLRAAGRGERAPIDGVVEIGSTGRYVSSMREAVPVRGDIVLVHTHAPTMGPVDVLERGQLGVLGRFAPLDDYAPLSEESVADESVDLVTCFIGLHHIAPDDVAPFLSSIARVLRPGGLFILRDHDVQTEPQRALVSLAHTVFNLGLGETLSFNHAEPRYFASVDNWVERVEAAGLEDLGERLLQPRDPTENVLMAFRKPGRRRRRRRRRARREEEE